MAAVTRSATRGRWMRDKTDTHARTLAQQNTNWAGGVGNSDSRQNKGGSNAANCARLRMFWVEKSTRMILAVFDVLFDGIIVVSREAPTALRTHTYIPDQQPQCSGGKAGRDTHRCRRRLGRWGRAHGHLHPRRRRPRRRRRRSGPPTSIHPFPSCASTFCRSFRQRGRSRPGSGATRTHTCTKTHTCTRAHRQRQRHTEIKTRIEHM